MPNPSQSQNSDSSTTSRSACNCSTLSRSRYPAEPLSDGIASTTFASWARYACNSLILVCTDLRFAAYDRKSTSNLTSCGITGSRFQVLGLYQRIRQTQHFIDIRRNSFSSLALRQV